MSSAVTGYPGVQLSLAIRISSSEFVGGVAVLVDSPAIIQPIRNRIIPETHTTRTKVFSTFPNTDTKYFFINGERTELFVIIQKPRISSTSEWGKE